MDKNQAIGLSVIALLVVGALVAKSAVAFTLSAIGTYTVVKWAVKKAFPHISL